MNKFLFENGFTLEKYPDGLFWVKRETKTHLIIQFTEDFKIISGVNYDGKVFHVRLSDD